MSEQMTDEEWLAYDMGEPMDDADLREMKLAAHPDLKPFTPIVKPEEVRALLATIAQRDERMKELEAGQEWLGGMLGGEIDRRIAAEATVDRYKVALYRIAGPPERCGPYKCEGLGDKFEPYDCVRCIATAALTGTEPGERT